MAEPIPPGPTEPAKPFWKSRTFWGAAIALLAILARQFGKEIDDDLQSQTLEIIMTIVGAIGTLLAIVGRWGARLPLAAGNRKPIDA